MIDKQIFNDYIDLKEQAKLIDLKIEELKPQILEQMQAAGAEEIVVEQRGTISLSSRRTWTYPPAIKKMEEDLKQAQVEAEAKGEASYKDNVFPLFNAVKIN